MTELDTYEDGPSVKLPRALRWPLLIVAFPVVLVTAVVWLPVMLLRKPEPPVNTTPCGRLCRYAYWIDEDKAPDGNAGWRCEAWQGIDCNHARRNFTSQEDPNNCTMFERKKRD